MYRVYKCTNLRYFINYNNLDNFLIWSFIMFLVCNNYNLYKNYQILYYTIIIFLITLELSVM